MTMTQTSNIVGILLAGGKSRRMFEGETGSGDKGLIEIAGKPMMKHVIDRLKPQVAALAINANGDPSRFDKFNLPVIADTIEGHVGPLAGVLTGMRWAHDTGQGVTHIMTAPTDAPLLPTNLADQLYLALENNDCKIALAASGGHTHPVAGLWPVDLADDLEQALHDGVRKVLHWTDRHGTCLAQFPLLELDGKMIDPFFNANTREELDQARALVEG